MQYISEFDIESFQFYHGAKATIKALEEAGITDLSPLEVMISEHFSGQTPTRGEINDYVWFNCDEILESLGIKE